MLLLASASKPRRKLLEQAGIEHKVMFSEVDERKYQAPEPKYLAQSLAVAKAKAVSSKLLNKNFQKSIDNQIDSILGCDSLFEFEGEVFGKPRNKEEALERWIRMSSKSGTLHTGHALLFKPTKIKQAFPNNFENMILGVVSTTVHFSDLSHFEIEKYVKTLEPLNCAGGFAMEGRGGLFIDKISGCYSNVIGLSLPWLRKSFLKSGLYNS